MNRYLADLHIHTALSPCASPQMTPPAIVRAAIDAGLTLIAICDHNSAGNVRAVQQSARQAGRPIAVLPGIEITTREEVHVLGLFAEPGDAEAAGEKASQTLPQLSVPACPQSGRPAETARPQRHDDFYRQSLLDADGQETGVEQRMLSAASAFSLEAAIELIHRHGGLAIASHVDRPSFSVISQLGLFPEQAGFDAIEVSAVHAHDERGRQFESFGLAAITSSDSHFLSDIGYARTELWMTEPTLAELRLALRSEAGRKWERNRG